MAASASAFDCPDSLDDKFEPFGFNYDVYYTNDEPLNKDYSTATLASWVGNALVQSHSLYTAWGFRDPHWSDSPSKACIYDSADTGQAKRDRMTIDAPKASVQSEPWVRFLTTHEQAHHVGYAYASNDEWPSLGKWVIEGTARALEDKLYLDIDQTPQASFYRGEVNGYLTGPNVPLFLAGKGYGSALFWTYAMEQLGAPIAEPWRGIDFMVALWDTIAELDRDGVQALRETLASYDENLTFENFFWISRSRTTPTTRTYLPCPSRLATRTSMSRSPVVIRLTPRSFRSHRRQSGPSNPVQ